MPSLAWCPRYPSDDPSIKQACDTVHALSEKPFVVYGNAGNALGQMSDADTLYVIAHGHKALPMFIVGAGKYTPSQFVDAVVQAGLRKKHRQIVMLVCHGGQSVGSKAEVKHRFKLNSKAINAKQSARQKAIDLAKRTFSQAKPSAFQSEDQVLPMVCQFVSELKARGYTHIRVKAFMGEVWSNFSFGHIEIKNPESGAFLKASAANTVEWL